jgi:hypothetical protein
MSVYATVHTRDGAADAENEGDLDSNAMARPQ